MTTATLSRGRTPPEVAKELGVEPSKIIAWIRQGELRAINVATRPTGRPRYRIDEEAIEEFLHRRATKPPTPAPPRRQRAATGATKDYFPE
jgi:excisionase family DNA binding protein